MEAASSQTSRPPFVVQKHWARNLHYDFRLQIGEVLVSWAVPKGPSLDPKVRRLAVRVEDHPLSYLLFEGELQEGEYGAGRVIVWDYGTYELVGPPHNKTQLESGELRFLLSGKKLRGRWTMIRTKMSMGARENWLLLKNRDRFAVSGYSPDTDPTSALTQLEPDVPVPLRR